MTRDASSDDERALDAALGALPEPELPAELARRLDAIPQRGMVRRFPVRSWRASALGWAAAAALGLFIGSHWADDEAGDAAASSGQTVEVAPAATAENDVSAADAAEDDDVGLALGSFTELDEEP